MKKQVIIDIVNARLEEALAVDAITEATLVDYMNILMQHGIRFGDLSKELQNAIVQKANNLAKKSNASLLKSAIAAMSK